MCMNTSQVMIFTTQQEFVRNNIDFNPECKRLKLNPHWGISFHTGKR